MTVRYGSISNSSAALSQNLDAVILDHRVGQEFVGRRFQRGFGFGLVGARQFDIEHLALADAGDAIDAERLQRAFDGLALRIEDAGLQRNGDTCFHGNRLSSSPAPDRSRPAARSPSGCRDAAPL